MRKIDTPEIDMVRQLIKEMPPNKRHSHIKPFCEMRVYFGKRRMVIGYSWSLMASHYTTGVVYDRIIGYGDTFNDAVECAKNKIKKLTEK